MIFLSAPVRLPRLAGTSRVVDDVVSGVDVLPTLLDILRIPGTHGTRGRSAVELLLGRPDPGPARAVYLEQILEKYGSFDIRALRTRHRKLLSIRQRETSFREAWAKGDLLFDLALDPGEPQNLLQERPDEARAMRALLDRHMGESGSEAQRASEAVLEPEQMERLQALGYIG